jgi:hypothetical protein
MANGDYFVEVRAQGCDWVRSGYADGTYSREEAERFAYLLQRGNELNRYRIRQVCDLSPAEAARMLVDK